MTGWLMVAIASGVIFPGPIHRLISPDGRHVLVWEEPRGGDEDYTHRLRLGPADSSAARVVMKFYRHVQAEWSPSGRYVAVTCWCGSDFAAVTVIDVQRPERPIDVGRALVQRVGRIGALDNHHAYVEAPRWSDDRTLELRLWGYGKQNPRGFERRYSFPVGGIPALLSSRDKLPDGE